MSETKKDESKDLIGVNVALVLAENDSLKQLLEEKGKLVTELTKKLNDATDLIENDSKRRLITDISPMTTISKEILSKMSIDDLAKMKKTLEYASVPAFKAGTPMADNKYNPKKELDSMFDNYANSTWRKS
jgi:hypothetical protein